MARKAADVVVYWSTPEDDWESYNNDAVDRNGARDKLLESIPLAKLIEVARAARNIISGLNKGDIEHERSRHKGCAAGEMSSGDVVAIFDALQSLREELNFEE